MTRNQALTLAIHLSFVQTQGPWKIFSASLNCYRNAGFLARVNIHLQASLWKDLQRCQDPKCTIQWPLMKAKACPSLNQHGSRWSGWLIHVYNPNTHEAEAAGSLVWDQPGLCSKTLSPREMCPQGGGGFHSTRRLPASFSSVTPLRMTLSRAKGSHRSHVCGSEGLCHHAQYCSVLRRFS